MKTNPKHRTIYQQLLAEIEADKYSVTQKLPSEGQLVKRFGVSRPTVARALRDLEIEGRIVRKVGSGNFLQAPGQIRRRPGRRYLGLLIPGVGTVESIFDVICGEFAGMARMRDFDILWGYGMNSASAEEVEKICEDFIAKGVAGVVFAPLEGHESDIQANQNIALRLKRAAVPFVLLDRDIVSFPQRSSFDVVGLDNFRSGYVLAEHLIRLGVQRMVFFSRPLSAESVVQRRAGVVAAMVEHRIPIEGQFAFEGDPTDLKTVSAFVRGGRFEAVICANDHTAAQFAQSLNKLEVRIPIDLRIVGFDDFRLAGLLPVPLTTIKQPCRDIATIAFNTLQERILDPVIPARCILAAPQLIVRESCGGYLASASVTKAHTGEGVSAH